MTDVFIEDGLYAHLTAQSSITDVTGDRIYPGVLPQDPTLPAVVFYNVGSVPIATQDQKPVAMRTRFQIDCYARSNRDAKLLDKRIHDVLVQDSYHGVTFGSFAIRRVELLEGGMNDFDDVPNDFRITSEYEIWHTVVV